ncbi:fibronectin type III-like domain-contianing protein [Domibacillus sp. PGB-M46]|uniref:fibronectin type III-like domain-contianing protein n=1 Tax=Domibacillus sp. PGB-M46 TaxID=2910255 RepID=UPI0035C8D8B8
MFILIYIYIRRKELKGFEKITLKPSETKTVTFTIDKRALSIYDEASKNSTVEEGLFKVLIGSSSRHIKRKGQFRAVGASLK